MTVYVSASRAGNGGQRPGVALRAVERAACSGLAGRASSCDGVRGRKRAEGQPPLGSAATRAKGVPDAAGGGAAFLDIVTFDEWLHRANALRDGRRAAHRPALLDQEDTTIGPPVETAPLLALMLRGLGSGDGAAAVEYVRFAKHDDCADEAGSARQYSPCTPHRGSEAAARRRSCARRLLVRPAALCDAEGVRQKVFPLVQPTRASRRAGLHPSREAGYEAVGLGCEGRCATTPRGRRRAHARPLVRVYAYHAASTGAASIVRGSRCTSRSRGSAVAFAPAPPSARGAEVERGGRMGSINLQREAGAGVWRRFARWPELQPPRATRRSARAMASLAVPDDAMRDPQPPARRGPLGAAAARALPACGAVGAVAAIVAAVALRHDAHARHARRRAPRALRALPALAARVGAAPPSRTTGPTRRRCARSTALGGFFGLDPWHRLDADGTLCAAWTPLSWLQPWCTSPRRRPGPAGGGPPLRRLRVKPPDELPSRKFHQQRDRDEDPGLAASGRSPSSRRAARRQHAGTSCGRPACIGVIRAAASPTPGLPTSSVALGRSSWPKSSSSPTLRQRRDLGPKA